MNTLPLLATAGLSAALALPARWLGARYRLLTRDERHLPATGGFSLCGAWWLTALAAGLHEGRLLLGLLLATVVILLVGGRDLKRPLRWLPQLTGHVLASASAVLVGRVMTQHVTNPFGGLLPLDRWSVGGLAVPAVFLSVVWIIFLMNAVNFLDGMDGLAGVTSMIGFLTIGAVSLLPQVREPAVASAAFLAAATTAGFLFWNIPPASLTLGTPGAWFLGFLLAVLSIEGSSKIATLGVVGALPLFDAVLVLASRVRRGVSPFRGDRTHLHHRLAAAGFSPARILGLYASVSATLGLAAVLLSTPWKLLLLTLMGTGVFLARQALRHPCVDGPGGRL